MFNIATNNLKKELAGNGSPIKWIGACPVNPPIVAALSFEGVIKVWYIDDVEQDESDRIAEEGNVPTVGLVKIKKFKICFL